ncbi:PDZ domain-containing protein [Cellulomonas sp. P24]|uniref:YlbL family protein n=1 Tax=Cellulomonas sp. P24 TaxID=2885206 RepID=UPI00216B4DCF|nr:PDZ domain-containing protein [Cellulomonas sp. P24]MCR6492127.1 PDZ domain-containing protein [Cellulomonas sp. P24]
MTQPPAPGQPGPSEPQQTVDERPTAVVAPPSPRSVTLSLGMLATAVLVAVLAFLPVPYVVNSPGPTRNTLGELDGSPLISISGATTYPTTGKLLLTTASVQGGPGYPVDVFHVIEGWFSSGSTVQPVETVYPTGATSAEVAKAGEQQMASSQENATVAALTQLGYTVPATLTIAGDAAGTGASGVVEKGDVITSFDGKAVVSYQDLVDDLKATTPGDTVTLGVKRNGSPLDLSVVTGTKKSGGAQLGVLIDPTFTLPVDVKIKINDIGGPSAGMMFALGIIDKLTPADDAKGDVIAGTGTIDIDGTVGPIGDIRQKFHGALRDGATWFLAPASNCADVIGAVPAGLHVVKVSTLREAENAVQTIAAGKGATLPTCTAADVS